MASRVFFMAVSYFYLWLELSAVTSAGRLPRSPCPKIFKYERLAPAGDIIFPGKNHELWKGVVTVHRAHITPDEAIILRLLLAVPTALSTKYVGRIVFQGEKQTFLEGSAENGTYDVIFPSNCPVPHLLQLRVNDHVICSGMPPRSAVMTKIILENSLFPFRVNLTRTRTLLDSPLPAHTLGVGGSTGHECGDFSPSNPLVVRGRFSSEGDWPWLVPIFRKIDYGRRGIQFLCAGTLVSDIHIITAAHCLRDVEGPGDLIAYPGRRSIQEEDDIESWPVGVNEIVRHPDFQPLTMYSDLALMELEFPLTWSANIFPVCLWTGPVQLDLIVGKLATVVGWGTDEPDKTKLTSVPKSVELPVVSQETCLRSSHGFFFLSSNRTLCAGARNGVGPCNGDSGGGLYLPVKESSGMVRWYLRGVVSVSLQDKNTLRCDLHQFTVFTDVAQFLPWIQHAMSTHKVHDTYGGNA